MNENQNGNRSRLLDTFDAMATGLGLEEIDLYSKLGDELRTLWRIRASDPVKEIAICQIERLIERNVKKEKDQRLVYIFYNIVDRIPDDNAAQKELVQRLRWLVRDAHNSQWETMSIDTAYRRIKPIRRDFVRDILREPPSRSELVEMAEKRFGINLQLSELSEPDSEPVSPRPTDSLSQPQLEVAVSQARYLRPRTLVLVLAVVLIVVAGLLWGPSIKRHLFPSPPLTGSRTQRFPTSPATAAIGALKPPKDVAPDTNVHNAWVVPPQGTVHPVIEFTRPPIVNAGGKPGSDVTGLERFNAWVLQQGGATVGVTHLRVTLTAGAKEIDVQDICAHTTSQPTPMQGTLFFQGTQGETPEQTAINLNAAEPCGDYFNGHFLRIRALQKRIVDVEAVAHRGTVIWTLYAKIAGDSQKTINIDPGRPLRTTALLSDPGQYKQYYQYDFSGFRQASLSPDDAAYIERVMRQP